MKHPFLTLYYTGIGILSSVGVILTLVLINIPNITQAFIKETSAPKPYPESTDVKVLRDLPVENKTEIVIIKPKKLIQQTQNESSTSTVQNLNEKSPALSDTTKTSDSLK